MLHPRVRKRNSGSRALYGLLLAIQTETEMNCIVDGCDGRILARKMCKKHYERWYRNGVTEIEPRTRKKCLICGKEAEARELCAAHYAQYRRANKPKCNIEGCENKMDAYGLCWPHLHKRKCKIDGCYNTIFRSSVCLEHYQEWRAAQKCKICGKETRARGLCNTHYRQQLEANK